MGRATFDTMSEFGTFLPFVASQHHGRYRGYRRHVTDGAGRPSLTLSGHRPNRNTAAQQAPCPYRKPHPAIEQTANRVMFMPDDRFSHVAGMRGPGSSDR